MRPAEVGLNTHLSCCMDCALSYTKKLRVLQVYRLSVQQLAFCHKIWITLFYGTPENIHNDCLYCKLSKKFYTCLFQFGCNFLKTFVTVTNFNFFSM